jgi:hypothetical protein
MGNHAALVIACAALGAVILQAAISWTPENSTSSAAGHLGSGAPAAAALGSTNLVPHESRDSTPNGWANLGAADGSRQLSMRIALTSQDAAGLQKAVMDVSTPGNAKYGKHLNAVQVRIRCNSPFIWHRLTRTNLGQQLPGPISRSPTGRDGVARIRGHQHTDPSRSRRLARLHDERLAGQPALRRVICDISSRGLRHPAHPHVGILHPCPPQAARRHRAPDDLVSSSSVSIVQGLKVD